MDVPEYIYARLVQAGMTREGAAAVLGNVQHESAFKSDNVEDRSGINDQEYVRRVNSGAMTKQQFMIYGIGNLFGLLSLLMIRLLGKDRICGNVLLVLLFALCTQLFMQMGRACIAVINGAAFETGIHFITTDALSGLFTMVIVWIASRLDGVFEDQISYLLRLQKEAEEEKGGFS